MTTKEEGPLIDSMAFSRLQAEPTSSSNITSAVRPVNPYKVAIFRTTVAVFLAHLFMALIYFDAIPMMKNGPSKAFEFYSCFLIEESLSMDNLFAFYMIFKYFKVPLPAQNRALYWGIFGAIVLRALMISVGSFAVSRFHSLLFVFAGILIYSGVKILVWGDDDDENDMQENRVVRCTKWAFGSLLVGEFHGVDFFTRPKGKGAHIKATPLLLVLVVVELSDVIFAVDSVPAAFGISTDPFIIYTANMFAIMSLRSLYQVVAQLVADLPHVQKSIALVLIFIGLKMILEFLGYSVTTFMSMAVVVFLLSAGVVTSLLIPLPVQSENGTTAIQKV